MATLQVTNQKASAALIGGIVLVTLNSVEAVSDLPLLAVGQSVLAGSTGDLGTIASVDLLGMSFEVAPISRAKKFGSVVQGVLSVNEIIQVTL